MIRLKFGKKTALRRFFVIKTLLDGKKWDTQSLLRKINRDHLVTFKNQHSIDLTDIYFEDVTDPMLSKILKSLRKDKIIKSEPIPQNTGRGPSGYQHWLTNDFEIYFKVLLEFMDFADYLDYYETTTEDLHTCNRSIFLNSTYGQKFINMDLFKFFKSKLGMDVDEKSKKMILKILKISPSALREFYLFVIGTKEYFEVFQMRDEQITKENFMSRILSSFIKDLITPSFWTPYPIKFKSVFLIDEGCKDRNKPINRPRFVFNIEENSLSFNVSANGVEYPPKNHI